MNNLEVPLSTPAPVTHGRMAVQVRNASVVYQTADTPFSKSAVMLARLVFVSCNNRAYSR